MTEEIDKRLAEALKARPEFMPAPDLAARALVRARTAEARFHRLATLARWTRVASAAAGILLVLILALGYSQWNATSSDDSSNSSINTSNAVTAAGGDASTSEPLSGGLTLLVGSLVVFSIASLLAADRPAPSVATMA